MLRNYLLLAWKVLLRRKFFTFISLVGISLTLATLLVVTALIDYHAHPPKPYSKQSRMLFVKGMMAKGKDNTNISEAHYGFHDKYVRPLPGMEKFSIQSETTFIAYPQGHQEILTARLVDGAFWEIYDFEFLEGNAFTEDDNAQSRLVAVVSEETQQRFFGNESAVGKSIALGDKTYRVIGVVRNVAETMFASGDVWIPVNINLTADAKADIMGGMSGGYSSTILAKNEADVRLIQQEFQTMLPRVQFQTSQFDRMIGAAETQFEVITQMMFGLDSNDEEYGQRDRTARAVLILIIAALVFMMLPAINLVNVNVSRIIERASEIGVRKAFGASAGTLVGQFVVENLVLTVIGGAIGIVLAEAILRTITASGLIAHAVFHINARVALYALGMAVVFGLLSGVLPAWKMSRLPIVESLKGGINA